jgi:hypothetical protein
MEYNHTLYFLHSENPMNPTHARPLSLSLIPKQLTIQKDAVCKMKTERNEI